MKRGVESSNAATSSNIKNVSKKPSDKENKKVETLKKQHVPDSVVIHDAVYEEDAPSSSPIAAIKSPVSKDNLYYNMSLKHRGNCIVFNHETFSSGIGDKREGSSADVASIKKTFSQLGFNVIVHDDLKFTEFDAELNNLMNIDYTDHSCLCIFVLTHGNSKGMLYVNDLGYPSDYLWKRFTADNCKTLAGKPKLFFIQACRGSNVDRGIPLCSAQSESNSSSYKLPVQADFLIAHSTLDDHVSWRHPTDGSWYLETLCKVIDKHWMTTDLLKMLTITARIVATEYVSKNDDDNLNEMVQMPTFTSTLTRDLLFPSMDA